MGKSKNLADLLSASGLIGSEDIESDAIPPSGATTYATIDDLPLTGLTSGALAYISSTDTFYIANGDGWYKVTTVNTAPNISNVASSFDRGLLNLSNVSIEAVASDAEGIPVSVSYQLEPASVPFVNGLSTVGDVLTVDIVAANTAGSANVVVSTSDGVNISTVKSLINFSSFDGSVDFLLIGGGGGGGGIIDGGGGAGGYRASWGTDPISNGGTVTEYVDNGTKYYVHTFTSSGTFTTSSLSLANVDILLVGGGGGGAGGGSGAGGGGGGAGGVVYSTNQTLASNTAFTITVGSGGSSNYYGAGNDGNDTTMTGQTTAVGGGGGGPGNNTGGRNGGSGGGSGAWGEAVGTGTSGQGNDGGESDGDGAGGGGGAGAVGGDGVLDLGGISYGGDGGDGVQIDITGTNVYYGGGGGGTSGYGYNGQGGLGGGGDAGYYAAGGNGDPLTGGGGGGGLEDIGGTGGSGVVIIRYALTEDQLGTTGNSGGLSTLESQLTLSPGTAYTVTVGAGGQGGLGYNNGANHIGHKGRDTSISGSDITTLTAEGGGGGSGLNVTSTEMDGGSGGGGGNIQDGGSGTANQGHSGGNDSSSGNNTGGGGGAGAVGQTAPTTTSSGAGGDGLPSTISGVSVTRAGGGGGGLRNTTGTASGAGGAGGGGNGGYQSLAAVDYNGGAGTQTTATHAKQHTGSGGGGGGYNGNSNLQQGGNGASGTAIFRLPSNALYDANTFASDITSASNMNAQYLNTGVYAGDPNYGDVKLLLDGTSLTEDKSLNSLTLTDNGGVLVTTTDPGTHPFATSFLDFGSSAGSRYLTNSSSDWAFGTGQFTAEGWAYVNSHKSYQKLLTTRPTNAGWSTAWDIGMDSSGKITIYSNTFLQQSAASAVPTGQWFHYAWTRDASNVCRLFVDGVVVDTDTITTNFDKTDLGIGNFPVTPQAGEQLYGYQTGIRITTGVARYTSAFTPSTTAFPHHSTASGGDHVLIFQQTTQTQYDGVTDTSSSCIWTPSFT